MSVQNIVQSGFDLIDCQETAEILGISKSALEAWRTTGRYKLPFIKVGRNVRYRRSDVLQWLESRTRVNGTTA
jgi:excisionase family DNA binding protein